MSVGEEIRAAIEVKRDAEYMAKLQQPAPWIREYWLGWDGMTNVTGLRSIILKIALHLDELIGQPSIMTMTPVRRTINLTEPGRGRVVPIRVQSLLGSGTIGICLRGMMGTTAVVVKLERTGQRAALSNEAGVYEHKLSRFMGSSDQLPAPRYYGYFEDPQDRRALVTEYVGPALKSFDELTEKMKTDLLRKVRRLHRAGVNHNDLEPRNITCGVKGIKIIDYSHSSWHTCKGRVRNWRKRKRWKPVATAAKSTHPNEKDKPLGGASEGRRCDTTARLPDGGIGGRVS
ncbi:MAG: hypothetical protein M1826_002829 [Phylliscum demangeonii]|nr:MAG: hypothetical protein M1826_002829 [Phylliscum demangeonii]